MGLEDSDILDDGDGGKSVSSVSCSICLEVVTDNGDRSWAKLQCGHQFHLDCIGSAINIKGAMQCPNCRKIEKGQWLYASGCRAFPEFSMEDLAHDEDLYDLGYYSEMSFGVHWCPFSGLTRLPSSFDDGDFSSTPYHDLLGRAIFSEHTAVPSATHPCPYIAYFGPIHPSSSNPTGSVSDSTNFNSHWNGPSIPGEIPTSYTFPALDLHYHSWEHHSTPFSTTTGRVGGGADQPSVPSISQRSSRANSDIPRSASVMHPFLVGHSAGARAGSSVASSMIPPYPGSNARARDRVQALQAYYQQQQPSNSLGVRAPVVSGTRRSGHRGLAQVGQMASSSEQTGGFYFFPPGTSSRSFQEGENHLPTRYHGWERDHLPAHPFNVIDRDSNWGSFHQPNGGSESGTRQGGYRQRHGSERTPSQNRS